MDGFKRHIEEHFARLVAGGLSPNEAAAEALRLAKKGATVAAPPCAEAVSRYGPLCRALVGPFKSICVVGQPRRHKKLLVLDIDHTIYDPSEYAGARGSTVKQDEAMMSRCRPRLHELLGL